MFQLVRTYAAIADAAGTAYQPRAYAEVRLDGWWDGWLVFFPVPAGAAIATDRETTQPSFTDLVHWSGTLGPVYLEGALERAQRIQLEPSISTILAELAVREAVEDEVALETAAAEARADAEAAARDAAIHETAAAVARDEARERLDDAQALERTLFGDEGSGNRRRAEAADRRSSRKRSTKAGRGRKAGRSPQE